MPLKSCPFCKRELDLEATRCPYCCEWLRGHTGEAESLQAAIWRVWEKNFNKSTWPKHVFWLMTVAVFVYIGSHYRHAGLAWLIGVLVYFGATLFDVNKTAVISMATLLIVGVATFEQVQNFQIHNRPQLEIHPGHLDFLKDSKTKQGEKRLELALTIKNTGPIAALVESIDYAVFVPCEEAYKDVPGEKIQGIELSRLNQGFNAIEWKNVPVFSQGGEMSQSIVNDPFGQFHVSLLGEGKKDVYSWMQINYRPVGDKTEYSFWGIFKHEMGGQGGIRFISAGDTKRDLAKDEIIINSLSCD